METTETQTETHDTEPNPEGPGWQTTRWDRQIGEYRGLAWGPTKEEAQAQARRDSAHDAAWDAADRIAEAIG